MDAQHRAFSFNFYAILVLLIAGLFHTGFPCSPDPNKPQRSLTELTILAPVVIVANVTNISVSSVMQMFSQYSACLDVKEVIKGPESFTIPQTFCTGDFGTDAMCLTHVTPGSSYLIYLNTDLRARYDSHFSAASPANDVTIRLAREGFCNSSSEVNDSSCVPPFITDVSDQTIAVEEGKSLSLTCHASGNRPYVVTWYFKRPTHTMPLSASVQYDGSLFLSAVTASCQGVYTCVVRNAAGMASQDKRVIVELKPCGESMMVNKRTHIYTPNFPGQYPADKSCAWRFCPPTGKRIKFLFNVFHLEEHDSITIINECKMSQDPWRKYCGKTSPREFVSRCASGCVQLRLLSSNKMQNWGDPFFGMNLTVEATSEKRTPRFGYLKQYCSSDFVLKGRLIRENSWSSIKIHALESYKKPYQKNVSYNLVYSTKDRYGCYQYFNFIKDHFFLGIVQDKLMKVKMILPDDNKPGSVFFKKKINKYKQMESLCIPKK